MIPLKINCATVTLGINVIGELMWELEREDEWASGYNQLHAIQII